MTYDGTELGSIDYLAGYVSAVRAIEQWAVIIQRELGTHHAADYLAACGVSPERAHVFLMPWVSGPRDSLDCGHIDVSVASMSDWLLATNG